MIGIFLQLNYYGLPNLHSLRARGGETQNLYSGTEVMAIPGISKNQFHELSTGVIQVQQIRLWGRQYLDRLPRILSEQTFGCLKTTLNYVSSEWSHKPSKSVTSF